MKLISALCAMALVVAPASARPLSQRLHDLPTEEWVYQGLHLVDVIQTEEALHHGCIERNPLLGRHPSLPRLAGTWVATSATHAAITMVLQDRAPRAVPLWEHISVAIGVGVVASNFTVRF